MTKARVVLCLLWLAGSLADAQNTTESAHGNKTLLIALENGWNQAQLHHDSKALDGLVADTFISTDNDGTFMTKAQFLDDNKDLSYAPSLMTNSEERVFLYGDAAVVAGIYHAKGLNKGKPFDHYGRFTDSRTCGLIFPANGCAWPVIQVRSRKSPENKGQEALCLDQMFSVTHRDS
jgi:hypothetical protein